MKFFIKFVSAFATAIAIPAASLADCFVLNDGMAIDEYFSPKRYTTSSGTKLYVENTAYFQMDRPKAPVFQRAKNIVQRSLCFNHRSALVMDASGMRASILHSETGKDTIRFNVCHRGGNANASVSRRLPPEYIGNFFRLDRVDLTGDAGNVATATVVRVGESLNGVDAEFEVSYLSDGPISTFLLGGTELHFHSVCID